MSGLAVASCGGRSGLSLLEAAPEKPIPVTTTAPAPCPADMCPDDGDACNGVELCDPATNTCQRSAAPVCDDGLTCNGVERCDPRVGCVPGTPVTCDAPGERCDEKTGACKCSPPFISPDCNVKTRLFAQLGQVRDLGEQQGVLWVTTSTGLWSLDFAGTPADPADDTWAYFDELQGASDSGKLVIDAHGTKWFEGTYDHQLVRFDDAGTPRVRADDTWYFYANPASFWPNGLGVDATGRAWFGTSGVPVVFSDGGTPGNPADDLWQSASELGAPSGLVDVSSIDVMSRQPEGLVWLGASSGKLFAYDVAARQFAELSEPSWSRIDGLAWQNRTLWVSFGSGADFEPTLAAMPVEGAVTSTSIAAAALYRVPHSVETFGVDDGGRVWASDGGSNFSCLDPGLRAWSSWNLGTAVSSIRPRSATELWLGGDGVFHFDDGGSCSERSMTELSPEQALHSGARALAIEGQGVWLATDGGVDYLDTAGTPFDTEDDRWAHFDTRDCAGLEELQGVLVGPDGIKYFWGQNRVFAFDDSGTPWDKSDDNWIGHDTDPLWVKGVLDPAGRLLVVARTGQASTETPQVVAFDLGGTPRDGSDDVVTTIDSGLPGIGRNMTIDSQGELWLATETDSGGGNLYHWDRAGTPLLGTDDVWTPVRAEDGRVWKLQADPTGGIWGTVAEGVFQFYDSGTPNDASDDYWHIYPDLGSAMDIGPDGVGWFRMPGGVGILDVGGTPRDPSDDVAKVLLSPDALRFDSDLYTNGVIDDHGRFWVVADYVQVFEVVR